MLYAVKGNKQLKIDEAERQRYLNLGFDIAEDRGGKLEIVQHAPSKTVPYAQYELLQKENELLQKENELLQKENEALKKEFEASQQKVKELEKKLKGTEKDTERDAAKEK